MNNKQLATIKASDVVNQNAKFNQLVEYTAYIEAQTKMLKEAWDKVDDAMRTYNIKTLKGDWGTVSRGERKVWTADQNLDPKFYKQVLDTTKLNAMAKVDMIPDGASFTISEYLRKSIKGGTNEQN